jgi:serine-type D-Ala-D-Ala carboxypeptidase (penicillin-binding protein 5/6)
VSIMRHDGSFWGDVASLLDWGFATRGKAIPVGHLVAPIPPPPPLPTASPATPTPAPVAVSDPAGTARGEESVPPGLYVLGAGLLGGVIWLAYGLRRRFR